MCVNVYIYPRARSRDSTHFVDSQVKRIHIYIHVYVYIERERDREREREMCICVYISTRVSEVGTVLNSSTARYTQTNTYMHTYIDS